MHRFITIITLLVALALGVSGTTKTVSLKYKPKKEVSDSRHHAPVYPSIYVFYETETRTLDISGDESLEAQVYLCDIKGNMEDYSPALKACFHIIETGTHRIVIDSEDWIAEGTLSN